MESTIFSLYFANPSSTYEKETMSSTYHEILQAINADTKIAPECEKYLILVQGKRASKHAIAQDSEGSNAAPLWSTNIVCVFCWFISHQSSNHLQSNVGLILVAKRNRHYERLIFYSLSWHNRPRQILVTNLDSQTKEKSLKRLWNYSLWKDYPLLKT